MLFVWLVVGVIGLRCFALCVVIFGFIDGIVGLAPAVGLFGCLFFVFCCV